MDGLIDPANGAHDAARGEEATPVQATPAQKAPLAPRRVLADSLLDRLAQLNRARRALRDMNLRVARVVWCDGSPFIEIEREPHVSLNALLDRMGRRVFRCVNGRTRITGSFLGVTVCWFESGNDEEAGTAGVGAHNGTGIGEGLEQ